VFRNRKKWIIIFVIFFFLTLWGMYCDNRYYEASNTGQTIQTNGTPVSNHTVILDAGHGEPDRGSSFG